MKYGELKQRTKELLNDLPFEVRLNDSTLTMRIDLCFTERAEINYLVLENDDYAEEVIVGIARRHATELYRHTLALLEKMGVNPDEVRGRQA